MPANLVPSDGSRTVAAASVEHRDEKLPFLVSVEQAMRLLSIGKTRIYELMAVGGPLAPVKLGARTLIRRGDIEALVAALPAAEIGNRKTAA